MYNQSPPQFFSIISKQAQLNAFKNGLFSYYLGQILSLPPSCLLSPPTSTSTLPSTFPPPFEARWTVIMSLHATKQV